MDQNSRENNKYTPVLKLKTGEILPDDKRILDSDAVLEIELTEGQNKNTVISFTSCLSYRKLSEFESYRTLGLISSSSELGHIMYLVEKSDYLNWFQSEGMGARDAGSLFHFCITSYSNIIDVITLDKPNVNGRKLSLEKF